MPTDEGYYTTYDLGTVNREDLLDVITMISPAWTVRSTWKRICRRP